jgi:hypothetical protein
MFEKIQIWTKSTLNKFKSKQIRIWTNSNLNKSEFEQIWIWTNSSLNVFFKFEHEIRKLKRFRIEQVLIWTVFQNKIFESKHFLIHLIFQNLQKKEIEE